MPVSRKLCVIERFRQNFWSTGLTNTFFDQFFVSPKMGPFRILDRVILMKFLTHRVSLQINTFFQKILSRQKWQNTKMLISQNREIESHFSECFTCRVSLQRSHLDFPKILSRQKWRPI